jgi:hypothetical protein
MPSSIRPHRDPALRIRVAPEEVTIAHWPLVQQPIASLLALVLAGAASWVAGRAAGQWGVGLLVAGALAAATWQTWLPAHYHFSGNGVTRIVLGRRKVIPWSAIRHYTGRADRILLLPDAAVTPLSPLRGLSLRTGHQHEQVLANIEYFLQGWSGGSHTGRGRKPDSQPR